MAMRRILTIDGGGIKGVFAAAFLAALEDTLDTSVADHFDLIAGTSTGAIIAIGLGLGLPSREILRLYCDSAERIFPRRGIRALRGIFGAKYAATQLREVLTEAFGQRRIGESRTRLVIPTLNLATERVHLYKTSHHPSLFHDYKVTAVEAALAAVAAPTYFPIHVSPDGVPHIDGSVWASNPLGLAVIEAIGVLAWPRDEIEVLSLGCGAAPLNITWRKQISLGSSFWAMRLANVFMTAQSSSALVTAQVLLGSHRVHRICAEMDGRRFALDGVRHVPVLRQLGQDAAQRYLPELRSVFFNEPAEPFEPCHRLDAWAAPKAA
jgi:patatin-like phospholipase/acyl hydrolase